ncbi:MAG: hypothetical protein IPH78_15120 [Bacteroidetes bacterium]|nr:hypothetical protein [Bacteroidota bacterium]
MSKETLHNIRLGIFVMAGILLLITGLYFHWEQYQHRSSVKTITLYVYVSKCERQKKGVNIRYAVLM